MQVAAKGRLRSLAALVAFAAWILGPSPAAGQLPTSLAEKARQALLLASITLRPPDAFYDPPANVPDKPGVLLRNEPLKDVILPPGMRGWRMLYTTTVDDST